MVDQEWEGCGGGFPPGPVSAQSAGKNFRKRGVRHAGTRPVL